jgi:ribonuclease-3 family protein
VWELHQRRRLCRRPARVRDLHRTAVAVVNAEAQARALQCLEPWLNETERDLVRRGRNRAGRGPRPAEAARYGEATGFETMLGWLFLRDPERLTELFDRLEESESPLSPSGR